MTNATGVPLARFVLGQTLADGTVLLQAMVAAGSNPIVTVRLNSLTKVVTLYTGTEAFVRVEPLLSPDSQVVTAGGTTCTRPITSNFVITCTGAQTGTFGSEALGNARYIFAITTN